VDFTFNTFAPLLPGRLHDDRMPMTIIARQAIDIRLMRVLSIFFLANELNVDERLALVLRTLREEGAINRAPTVVRNADSGTPGGADKSAMGAINRPLQVFRSFCLCA
jgi:hypothetical protein